MIYMIYIISSPYISFHLHHLMIMIIMSIYHVYIHSRNVSFRTVYHQLSSIIFDQALFTSAILEKRSYQFCHNY